MSGAMARSRWRLAPADPITDPPLHFARAAQTLRTALGQPLARSAHRAPATDELVQSAALLFLPGDLPGKHGAVDVRVDGGQDQPLKFRRLQGFDFPLHGVGDVEVVAAREGRPTRVATLPLGRGQPVLVDHLVVSEQHALSAAPAAGVRDHPFNRTASSVRERRL